MFFRLKLRVALLGVGVLAGILPGILLVGAIPVEARTLSDRVDALTGAREVVVVADAEGNRLVNVNGDRTFTPASTIKVFTAMLALDQLGESWRFSTEFYVDNDGMLIIRGKGDPSLVSEEIGRIALALKERLAGARLEGIGIDHSFYAPSIFIPGGQGSDNPYHAAVSALAVNFNTIHVERVKGRIQSAEEQTPLTTTAERVARFAAVSGRKRLNIGEDPVVIARYAAEIFRAKLRAAGVEVGDKITLTQAPQIQPIYVHRNSKTITEVCADMLQYSTNFISNQVFLTIGAVLRGAPASLEKSQAVANHYHSRDPRFKRLKVIEGSGLAKQNEVDAEGMLAVLEYFAKYKELLREDRGSRHKTGTLSVASTLVGYIETKNHGLVRYVIALDGGTGRRRWDVLELLQRHL